LAKKNHFSRLTIDFIMFRETNLVGRKTNANGDIFRNQKENKK